MADVTIASFHLVDVGARRAAAGFARIGLDRRELATTPGLIAARSMGAGRDGKMAASFRPDRRVVFAIWRGDGALDQFIAHSPVARRWSDAAGWQVRLRLIDGHGTWGGQRLLDGIEPATGRGGRVVTLTRAAIAPRALPAFLRHSRAMTRSVADVAGLRVVVGVGEVPIVRLGTVAVWDDEEAARRATHEWAEHASAMRSAIDERMFTESLFARFEPYAATGEWSGRDPLAQP